MTVFFTQELLDAVEARLKAVPSLSFTPKLIQQGSLQWYAENGELSQDLPAVYVWVPEVMITVEGNEDPIGMTTLSGHVGTTTQLRIAIVDLWAEGVTAKALYQRRLAYLKEVAGKLLGTAGQRYDFGIAVTDYQVLRAIPLRCEPIAPEEDAISQDNARRLWASALDCVVQGRATR